MSTLLLRDAAVLVCMDETRREIAGGGMFIRDGWIEQVGTSAELPSTADEVVDMTDHVVLPGFVNAHHHLFQGFDRACPACQTASMSEWLKALYPRWAKMTPADVALATRIGIAELLLSGCTTIADHQYIWPPGSLADDQIALARAMGVRFHLGRGFQNIGAGNGGFAPASLLETADAVLTDCDRIITAYHEPAPGSFTQVYIAPSSLRSVTPDLLRACAAMAADRNVGFHMHLGETRSEIDFCQERFGKRPLQVAADLGCLSSRTWLAHGVHFDGEDMAVLARHGCGICHCPSSNMRLAAGIAPIRDYIASGIRVGLGADGSASNDASNLLTEMRAALLLSRVEDRRAEPLLDPRRVLEFATIGGAGLLGRDDIGALAPGRVADFSCVDLGRIELLGAQDPVAALVLCMVPCVDHLWVHGRKLVHKQRPVHFDLAELAANVKSRAAPVVD